ncbi:MAG: DUF2867 domain-containing protein [Hyphomonadaceae bacterium]|nr:DUF2867 domain-containing protein [Hyphomonadaceae bacterium]
MSSDTPSPGERLDFFTVKAVSADQMTLFHSDHHLTVTVTLARMDTGGKLSAHVEIHNWTGQLCMVPVRPAHDPIVHTLLAKAT